MHANAGQKTRLSWGTKCRRRRYHRHLAIAADAI